MAVVKNKSNESSREFWSHVESIAKQVRRDSDEIRIKRANCGEHSASTVGVNCSAESTSTSESR